MFGHGRPTTKSERFPFLRPLLWIAAFIGLMELAVGADVAQHFQSSPFLAQKTTITNSTEFAEIFEHGICRANISWGGGAAQQVSGEIRLSDGHFSQLILLGTEPDVPGTIWLENGGIKFRMLSPKIFSGVHVTLACSPSAQLQFKLMDEQKNSESLKVFSVNEILQTKQRQTLDETGNIVLIERVAGDELSVKISRKTTIFQPGEELRLEVLPRFTTVSWEKNLVLSVTVNRCRTGEQLLETDIPILETATGMPIPVSLTLPQEEGAMDVVLATQVKTERGFMRSGKTRILAQRTVQLYLIAKNLVTPVSGQVKSDYRESLVETIDTHNPTWWKRFAKIPSLPKVANPSFASLDSVKNRISQIPLNPWENSNDLWQGTLGSGHLTPYQNSEQSFSHFSQLPPSHDPAIVPWEAFFVPLKEPNKPHFLEIDYISDLPQTLGISVVEPGCAGAISATTIDSGINIAENIVKDGTGKRVLQHRILFWPRTSQPMVLLSNKRNDQGAVFGGIRIYRAPDEFPRSIPVSQIGTKNQKRLFAAYYHRPMFCDNFSASKVPGQGEPVKMEISDWKTFQEGIDRMIQYMRMVGYGGVMMSVVSDGSALYPSELLTPTPRYDSGMFLLSGEDPVRKDVLEVMATRFDRENMIFIPSIDFGTPLIALEKRIRENSAAGQSPQETGLTWIGPNGVSIVEQLGTNYGRAPYYNVLHPQVQDEMLEVIRELVRRSASHSSFGGVAIQLSPDGYSILPDENWGMDDHTIQRFARERRIEISGTGPDRFFYRAEDIKKNHLEVWLRWRAEQLALFYKRVRNVITEARSDAKLYLAGARMFESPFCQRLLNPSLGNPLNIYPAMLYLGMDPIAYQDEPSIVFLRPEKVIASDSLAEAAIPLELSQANISQFFLQRDRSPGSLFYHPSLEGNISGFDAVCPHQPSRTWFYAEPTPGDSQNRARFVSHLADSDTMAIFDGGRMLSLGQEDAIREMIAQFQWLPQVPFKTYQPVNAEQSLQPITFRYVNTESGTYCYLVNTAPFSVPVRVVFHAQQGSRVSSLSALRSITPTQVVSEGFQWSETIRPYDFFAIHITDPQAVPTLVDVTRPSEICNPEHGQITQRINDLIERISYVRSGISWNVLANPGFEKQTASEDKETAPSAKSKHAIGTLFGRSGNNESESSQQIPVSLSEGIPNWNSTGDTTFEIKIDNSVAKAGNASVRICAAQTPGGMISEPFAMPNTGRLFVTAWIGIPEHAKDLPLRMTLVGRVNDKKLSRSATIGPAIWTQISQVPPINGVRWYSILVPFYDLPLSGLQSSQLQFELFHSGIVWIDDIQLYQLAFSDEERFSLMRLVHTATFRLGKERVSDSMFVLEGYWPKLLEKSVPDVEKIRRERLEAAATTTPETTSPPAENQKTSETKSAEPSGVLGRVKQWIPRFN